MVQPVVMRLAVPMVRLVMPMVGASYVMRWIMRSIEGVLGDATGVGAAGDANVEDGADRGVRALLVMSMVRMP